MHTKTQEKGAVTPQETEPDLPVSVQESLAEVWINSGCHGAKGTEYNSPGISPSEGGAITAITPNIVWSQAKQQGGNTASPINRKLI